MVETHPEKRHIGYARVSTYGQNLTLQRDAPTEAGCASKCRVPLQTAQPCVTRSNSRGGDTLMVWKLRLTRR
jgi:DNA invertase Pin-like site-specific DNA recombinase